jgi:hypothetical protein
LLTAESYGALETGELFDRFFPADIKLLEYSPLITLVRANMKAMPRS